MGRGVESEEGQNCWVVKKIGVFTIFERIKTVLRIQSFERVKIVGGVNIFEGEKIVNLFKGSKFGGFRNFSG